MYYAYINNKVLSDETLEKLKAKIPSFLSTHFSNKYVDITYEDEKGEWIDHEECYVNGNEIEEV